MATFNLLRNSRVFFTTNVNASTGAVNTTGFSTSNTQELTILDNFSFSQTTNADTITLNEAGGAPARGQRSFNTALNPVDFSFSSYIRPYLSSTVKAEEAPLWNALFTNYAIGDTAAVTTTTGTASAITYTAPTATTAPSLTLTFSASGITSATAGSTPTSSTLVIGEIVCIKGAVGAGANSANAPVRVVSASGSSIVVEYLTEPATAPILGNFNTAPVSFVRTAWIENAAASGDTGYTAAYSEVNIGRSGLNQLLTFGMVVIVDGVTYTFDNCALDQAMIDFGLDGIATVQWTGKATAMTSQTAATVTGTSFGGGLTGSFTAKSTSTKYITNKLSTVSLVSKLYGYDTSVGTTYNMALTGGSITIANNINYITPANIGVLNKPTTYYTGTRSITGTLNAYLKTGSTNSAGLLAQMLSDAASGTTEPKFQLSLSIGGSTNSTRVDLLMNGCNLQIPTVDAQPVISTAINFTAQGTDDYKSGQNYDIELNNELRVRYFGV
jgi:hypothetical protein